LQACIDGACNYRDHEEGIMRSLLLFSSLLCLCFVANAIAQQGPAKLPGVASDTTAGDTPPKPKPAVKPTRLACAAVCNKAVTEITLSDEDKKWFEQCAGALLCQGKPAFPLVYQPRPSDSDVGIDKDGGIGDYLLKKYRDIMG
jgi:hypothetical protein